MNFELIKEGIFDEFNEELNSLGDEELRLQLKSVLTRMSEYATLALVSGQTDRHRNNLLQLYSIAAAIVATEASQVESRVTSAATRIITSIVETALSTALAV